MGIESLSKPLWSYQCVCEECEAEDEDYNFSEDSSETSYISDEYIEEYYMSNLKDDMKSCFTRCNELRESGVSMEQYLVDERPLIATYSEECLRCGDRVRSYLLNTISYYILGDVPYYECIECMAREK